MSSKVPVNSLLNTVGNSPTFYNHYLLKYKYQDGKDLCDGQGSLRAAVHGVTECQT